MNETQPPVLIRATSAELPGAVLKVAGLSVLERAARQLRRKGPTLAAIAPDVPPPRPRYWPQDVPVFPTTDVDSLARDRHAQVVAGDVVRPHNRPDAPSLRVFDESSRRQAEDAIFADLLRGDLGVVARYLNKPISFRITRYLFCNLPVTPNQVTLIAGAVGLLGAALIASGGKLAMLAGFFLVHVQSILDGCDGELARVRFQQSDIGEWLDTIVDDGLNIALAVAIGTGLWRSTGSSTYLLIGLCAAGLLLVYNVIAYRELIRQGEGGEVLKIRWWFTRGVDLKNALASDGGRNRVSALIALGRRDLFIFAWLVLALVGLPHLSLFWISFIAVCNFVVAIVQVARPRR